MASSARNQVKTCPARRPAIPLALWQKRGAPERQKRCQCGRSPVKEDMEETEEGAVVGKSHDEEFGFYSKCSGEPEREDGIKGEPRSNYSQ